jgi:hypothetical protein
VSLFDDGPPAAVTCRHCGVSLMLTGNGVWTDADGFCGCIKGDERRPAIPHEPMPDGLVGAPGG